jgi:alpha-glucosidase
MTAKAALETRDRTKTAATYLWWQRGIIYQVYPRSFMDSNGDGVGDLCGLISRLDYLRGLGIDAVWLSPIYPSPMKDFGYDVANYTGIHPLFGTLDDFDLLIREAHAREIKLILDFVPNHTSDQHPWFIRRPAEGRRITGCPALAAAHGSTIRKRSNTTIMRFCASSPT